MSMFQPIARLYKQLNPATLSGAIDIVVVRHPNGTYACSPFHVRFGKFQVPYASISVPEVEIMINGELCESIQMIVGDNGEALFCSEADEEEIKDAEREEQQAAAIAKAAAEVNEMSSAGSESDLELEQDEEHSLADFEGDTTSDLHRSAHTVKRKRRRKRRSQSQLDSSSSKKRTSSGVMKSSSINKDNIGSTNKIGSSLFDLELDLNSISAQQTRPNDSAGLTPRKSSAFSVVGSDRDRLTTTTAATAAVGSASPKNLLPNVVIQLEPTTPEKEGKQSYPKTFSPAVLQQNSLPGEPPFCASDLEKSLPLSPLATSSLVDPHFLDRPESPKSDSEVATSTGNVIENVSWVWGEHLEPYKPEGPLSPNSNSHRVGLPAEEKASNQRVRSLSPPSTQERAKRTDAKEATKKGGMYLESLASVDQTTKQLYLYSKTPGYGSRDEEARSNRLTRKSSRSSQGSSLGVSGSPCDTAAASSSPSNASQFPYHVRETSYGMDENTSEVGSSMPQSPGVAMEDVTTQTHIGSDGEVLHCNIELSLCGGLKNAQTKIAQYTFEKYLITYEDFQNDPFGILSNPNLVVKMNGSFFKWQVAAPLIISHVVFQRSLDDPAKGKLMKEFMPMPSSSGRSWFGWRSRTAADDPSTLKPIASNGSISVSSNATASSFETALSVDSTMKLVSTPKKESTASKPTQEIAKTLPKVERKTSNRLTSSQISKLNLHSGSNDISFRITSQFMGSTTLQANIFVFEHSDKVIISDVDGTVTKSDVMGQILPQIGVTDWSQQHIVDLYQNIADNGYKFIYLSARAISMASMTKTYLRKIRQNEQPLPDGPLLLSPASLASAFHQEVILKKPEEFKIRCLTDIQGLFPDGQTDNPFYAGFGNKSSDSISYGSVGIPQSRIFIINPRGDVKIETALSIQTSYSDLSSKVDHLFPALNSRNKLNNLDFTTFKYWREVPHTASCLSLETSVNELTISTHSSSLERYPKK